MAWLSWRDVERVLAEEAPGSPLGRVAQVLRRVDMFRFAGDWPTAPAVDGRTATFYRAQVYYRYLPLPDLPGPWPYGLAGYAWAAPPAPIRPFTYRGV